MKICIIGNSHIACLKFGWDLIKDGYPNDSITFFGAHHLYLFDTAVENGKIVPLTDTVRQSFKITSDGLDCIDLSDYDFVVLHGIMNDLLYFKGHYFFRNRFYSEQVKDLHVQNMLNIHPALHMIRLVSSVSPIPLLVSHKPFRAFHIQSESVSQNDYETLVSAMSRDLGKLGAIFFEQPRETINNYHYTFISYAKSSMRLPPHNQETDFHEEGEINHMNSEFGEIYLHHLFRKIADLNQDQI